MRRCLLSHIRVRIARCKSRSRKDLDTNQQDTSYFGSMAFDPKLMPLFDRSDPEQSVVEWLEKAELICQLNSVKRIESVIPIHLSGGAYAVYQQLSGEKHTDFSYMEKALYMAFTLDPFTVWKQFVVHCLHLGEEGLQCVFIARLSEHAEQLI